MYLVIMYKFVHSARSQSCPDSVDNCHACIYVADELSSALACVRPLPQENDLGLLQAQT